MIPSLVATGGTLNLETVVTTKPAPPLNSITVRASHMVGSNASLLPGKTDGVGHRVPMTVNDFSFFHSFSIPADANTGDTVEVVIDFSDVPRDPYCTGSVGEIVKNVHIVQGMYVLCVYYGVYDFGVSIAIVHLSSGALC